jgi:hypothetical protein
MNAPITIYSDPTTLDEASILAAYLNDHNPFDLDGSLTLGAAVVGTSTPSQEVAAGNKVRVTTDPEGPADLMVVPNTYMAARRVMHGNVLNYCSTTLLVQRPGRALHTGDMRATLGGTIIDASILGDAAVMRSLDAGLLGMKRPNDLLRRLLNEVEGILAPLSA